MKAFLNLCLLFSLISPVVLRTCQKCFYLGSTDCPIATYQKCNSNSSCRTSIFDSNVLFKAKQVKKSCSPSTSCDPGEYSFTTSGGGFMKMAADCCSTDKCNSKSLKFSSNKKEPNGLECEGCYAQGQGTCKTNGMVKCLGDQTKCISMDITYTASDPFVNARTVFFSAKGCATPQMCDQSKWKKNVEFRTLVINKITANCTDPISSSNVSSLA